MGSPVHRHEKVPGSSAVETPGVELGVEVTKLRGRYPNSASSCWTRSVDNGATWKVEVTEAARCAPVAPTTPLGPPGTVSVTV